MPVLPPRAAGLPPPGESLLLMIDLPAFPSGPAAPPPNLTRVVALICVAQSERRLLVAKALAAVGIRAVVEATTFTAAREACAKGGYQLLILEQDMAGTDSTPLLRDLRQGSFGPDPFVIAVMLLATRDERRVRAAINSGPDDLVLVPFSSAQLSGRLTALAERRKSFIVTHDYIGPDRRTAPRPGRAAAPAPQILVPNPLRARSADWPPERYEQAKGDAIQAVALERIRRLAAALEWECAALLVAWRDSALTAGAIGAALARSDVLAHELATRGATLLNHPTTGIDALRAELARLVSVAETIERADLDALLAAARHLAADYTAAAS